MTILNNMVDLGSTQTNFLRIYVSKLNGSPTGNGSLLNPFDNIGDAITAAGAPANPFDILVTDGETYDEQIVITNPNINLIAPDATLFSTTGDTITINIASGTPDLQIIAYNVFSAIGNGLVSINSEVIFLTLNYLDASIVINTGALTIKAGRMDANLTVTGIGAIYYDTAYFNGIVTPGPGIIEGTSGQGASSTFNIAGKLTVLGLGYPITDGTPNQAVVTDGFGTLSFATLAGTALPLSLDLSPVGFQNTITPSYLTIDAPAIGGAYTVYVWVPSSSPGGTPYSYSPTGSGILGSQNFYLDVGTYSIVVEYAQQGNFGIYDYVTTGPGGFSDTQTIDGYDSGTQPYNFRYWTITTTVAGLYNMAITGNGKNILASAFLIGLIDVSLVKTA